MRHLFVLLGLALAVVPGSAHALRVPLADFEGSLEARPVGANATVNESRVALVIGAVAAEGTTDGLFAFAQTSVATVAGVTRVEVYDLSGRTPIDFNASARIGRPVVGVWEGVRLELSENASFYFYTENATLEHSSSTPFAFMAAFTPPAPEAVRSLNLPLGPSGAIVGEGSFRGRLAPESVDAYLLAANANTTTTVTVESSGETHDFTGANFLFRLIQTAELEAAAQVLLVPFQGTVATVQPAPTELAQAQFDLERVNEALRSFTDSGSGGGTPQVLSDQRAADLLRSFAPTLNGALIGNPEGDVLLEGKHQTLGAFSLLRFEILTVTESAFEGRLDYAGQGRFLLAGDALYSRHTAVGALGFPVVSLLLWFLAVAALVANMFLPPVLPQDPAFAAPAVRLGTLAAWILAAIVVFVLWDMEVRAFVGTSLLTTFAGNQPSDLSLPLVAALQLFPYGLAAFYFALPMRLLTNSALKLLQLRRAKALGGALGQIALWGLGAIHLPALLNPIIRMLLERLG